MLWLTMASHSSIAKPSNPTRMDAADIATHLSPLDPMLFAIVGREHSRCCGLGRAEEAAEFPFVVDSNRTPMFGTRNCRIDACDRRTNR